MGQKRDRFQAFPDALPRYFGEQAGSSGRGEKWRTEKDFLTMLRHSMRKSSSSKGAWQRGKLFGKPAQDIR